MASGINFRVSKEYNRCLRQKLLSLTERGWQATWRQCVYRSQESAGLVLAALHATAMTALAACTQQQCAGCGISCNFYDVRSDFRTK